MSSTSDNITEADILSAVVAPDNGDLPAEAARSLLTLHFRPQAVERMNTLAERNGRGDLSTGERAELEKYLRVGQFLNLIQAKARLSLVPRPPAAD
jgi:hypothetical protein